MDPHCFDANVHPAKMEMRFRNAEELYSSVMSAVRSSFVKKELIPKVGIGNDKKGKEKEVITFFVTDDLNHLPVRLDLFLNFGSAKAFLNNVTGNRHPLTSIVK